MMCEDFSKWCKLSLVSLNNEGVTMIMEGRYCQAIHAFNSAVRMFQSFLGRQDTPSSSSFDRIVYCVNDHEEILSVPITHQGATNTSRLGVSSQEECQCFNVFQLPMLVVDENQPCDPQSTTGIPHSGTRTRIVDVSSPPPEDDDDDHHQQQQQHNNDEAPPCQRHHFAKKRLDFVLFYNLALCYHLSGLRECPNQSSATTMLQNAVECYKQAYRVLIVSTDELPVARAMVILNNVGQIYQQLNDEGGAISCFHRLLSTMLIIHQSGETSRIDHWDSFVANVKQCCLLSSRPSSSSTSSLPAPAA